MSSLKILLVNIFFGFGSGQLSFRAPTTCTTLTGAKCVFPFTYEDQTYYECTRWFTIKQKWFVLEGDFLRSTFPFSDRILWTAPTGALPRLIRPVMSSSTVGATAQWPRVLWRLALVTRWGGLTLGGPVCSPSLWGERHTQSAPQAGRRQPAPQSSSGASSQSRLVR